MVRAAFILTMMIVVAGCDEYVEPEAETVTTEAPAPSSPSTDVDDAMNAGRSSTLGRARDAAETTEANADQYNAALEKAMEED